MWFFMLWQNLKPLSHSAISIVWLFMCIAWWFLKLPMTISSTRNHFFLQSNFNMASILLSLVASLCLFYPSGIIFFSFMALSTWPWFCRVMLVFLRLFHPPVIIIFFPRAPSKRLGLFWTLLSSLWLFHPPGIVSFSAPLISYSQRLWLI